MGGSNKKTRGNRNHPSLKRRRRDQRLFHATMGLVPSRFSPLLTNWKSVKAEYSSVFLCFSMV